MTDYPRDMKGYGRNPPDPRWPGGAKVCVQFVVNYEEGGENNILHGDAASEAFLSEIVGAAAWPGQRHLARDAARAGSPAIVRGPPFPAAHPRSPSSCSARRCASTGPSPRTSARPFLARKSS